MNNPTADIYTSRPSTFRFYILTGPVPIAEILKCGVKVFYIFRENLFGRPFAGQ